MMHFDENRLTVTGIEVPDNKISSTAGTKVRLSSGQYLGGVHDIKITGGVDDAWRVKVVTEALLTNDQVANLFVKGCHIPPRHNEQAGYMFANGGYVEHEPQGVPAGIVQRGEVNGQSINPQPAKNIDPIKPLPAKG